MFEMAAYKIVSLHLWRLLMIHTASNPPNAPETVAAEKKIAARRPNSERLYQLERFHVLFSLMGRGLACV
jgi:hypothetical protein